jgi:hypothetical protein
MVLDENVGRSATNAGFRTLNSGLATYFAVGSRG